MAAEVSGLFEQCLAHVQQPLNVQLPSELMHSDRSRIKRNRPVWLALGLALCIFGVLGPLASIYLYQGKPAIFSRTQTSTPPLVGQSINPPRIWKQVDPLPAPPEEELLQRLSEPSDVNMQDIPLSDAIAQVLGEIPHELESNIDGSNKRIFINGRSTRSGLLTRILTGQELGYIVHADRVEIASRESVEARPVVRSYCLSHVTQNDQQASELVEALRNLFGSSDPKGPQMMLSGSVLMVKGTEAEHERLIAFLVAWKDRVRR